jgi:hypothetical protein
MCALSTAPGLSPGVTSASCCRRFCWLHTPFCSDMWTTAVPSFHHFSALEFVGIRIGLSMHFGWLLCGNTVSLPLFVGFLSGKLVPAWLTAILMVLLGAVAVFVCKVWVLLMIVSFVCENCKRMLSVVVAIRTMQVRRLDGRVSGPSSLIVVWTCNILIASIIAYTFVFSLLKKL